MGDNELHILVEGVMAHYDEVFRLKSSGAKAYVFHMLSAFEIEFTRSQIIAAIPGTFFCAWYASQKHWLANNILGLAFCIQVCSLVSSHFLALCIREVAKRLPYKHFNLALGIFKKDDEILVPHNDFIEGPQSMEGEIFNSHLFFYVCFSGN
ncbi:hypothetical protein REPUB_Repub03eG0174800 [Reevesia pubescens]